MKKPYQAYNAPLQGNAFASRQYQNRTAAPRKRYNAAGRVSRPAFSLRTLRLDTRTVVLALLLVLLAGILIADISDVRAVSDRIWKLNAGIESLKDSNISLQEAISLRMTHPVLVRMSEEAAAEAAAEAAEETVITLSVAPLS